MYKILLSPYSKIFYNEWKLDQDRSDYNIVFDQNLEGNIDISKLNIALKRFISEYLLLNSHIKNQSENLYWVRNDKIYDLDYFSDNIANQDILKYVKKPFNLESGPLYRIALIKNNLNKYRFIFVLHHIIIDGVSFDGFIDELSNYYNDKKYSNKFSIKKQSLVISNLSKKFYKYLKLNKNKSKLFWKKQLSEIDQLDFNFLKLKNNNNLLVESNLTNEVRFNFSKETIIKLSELELTPYLYGQIIYALLIYRYTHKSKFCISYPISIKEGREFVYGAQINTNIILYDFNKINTVNDLIIQSKNFIRLLNGKNTIHSYLPIYSIVSSSNRYLLNISFVQTNFRDKVLKFKNILANINNTNIDLLNELIFEQEIENDIIKYRVRYNNKINSTLLQQFIECYKSLFIDILNDLYHSHLKCIKDYKLLSSKLYDLTINEWNKTDKEYKSESTINELFEEQVAKSPDSIAVVYEDIRLTYSELNERANRLAHYLREKYDVKSDSLVGICLDRSEHILIGILAVLKAGGAYVPIDPSYPDDRIKYIIEDGGILAVLTNNSYEKRLKTIDQGTNIISIDSDKILRELESESSGNLEKSITSNNLAYVIYTSGTTGKPKGVLQLHSNVMRLFTATDDFYKFNNKDVWTLFHSYVFDFSVWEIWGALIYGGKLIIPSYEQTRDLNSFYKLYKKQCVTVLNQTPSAFYQFADIAITKDITNKLIKLRYVIFGGEALNIYQLKPWFDSYGHNGPKLVNMYGITETTVHVTHRLIEEQDLSENSYIGKVIDDLNAYVLDSNLLPLPIGAIGELYIGGAGLARGYLNRADLTAERFIANPFQNEEERKSGKNGRLYKTGDLVRWLPDGNLEYIGRNDFQVKIRGYRIELGEIESALSSYEGIKQSVVLAKDHKNIDASLNSSKYLVGYYVSERKLDENIIIDYLKTKLPEYMIPNILVYLEKLPLTINGKLDRKALPDPELTDIENYVAPRNETEKKLCKIWSEILGLDENKVGIRDDFFKLGGDSILAIRIVGKINKELNCKIKVKDIFEHREIYKLIDIVHSNNENTDEKIELYKPFSLVNVKDYKYAISNIKLIEDIYPASYLQMGMLLESSLDNKGTYHDVFSYSIKNKFDKTKFLSIWKSLVNKHELLRASFILNSNNGWNVIIYKNIDSINHKIYLNQNTEELINNERLNNFDYSKPGLFRLIINDFRDSFDLIFSFHHAITDGWSVASLINEFIQSYVNDQAIEPKLKIRYGEFITNEISAIKNESNINFWKEYLNDLNVTKVNWKFDNEKSKNSLNSSYFSLSSEEVKLVHKIAKNLRISIDSIFLLAYMETLSYFTNNFDITVGVVVNNRLEDEEGDKLFGLFLNTIPFRLKLNNGQSNTNKLLNVFNKKIKLQQYKHLPYGYIKSLLKQDLYDFAFNFVHFHIMNDSLDYMESFYNYERTSIPFELNIFQNKHHNFSIKINVHDDYISKDYLDYFLNYYYQCLINILENQNNKLSLTKEDYTRIINEWNRTDKEYRNESTINELFEEQVAKSPDSIAVVYEDIKLTYSELNVRANKLAHHLMKLSNKPQLVALIIDRSINFLISMLGIFKAGWSYLPIDPAIPEDRIFFIINESKVSLILTESKYISSIKILNNDNRKIYIFEKLNLAKANDKNLNIEVSNNSLAYVIYTSGSTGKPKGAMVEYKGMINHLWIKIDDLKITSNDNIAQTATQSFDVSVWQFLSALIVGGTTTILKDSKAWEPSELLPIIKKRQITIFQTVPSHIQAISEESENDQDKNLIGLRLLILNGESLTSDICNRCLMLYPNVPIVNAYGPTECSDDVSHYKVYDVKDSNLMLRVVPIGKVLGNCKIYVLDNSLNLLPKGVTGKLYIGGDGVGRGYLNRADLTAERFIANPFQSEEERKLGKNTRIYETGDLVRWLPDGNLEYIGRNDFQVKIRGYRIELGEIESALSSYEGIKQSVVLAKDHKNIDASLNSSKYLVGYYVSDNELDNESIISYLEAKLPEYMVPNILVYLEKLPLTINGKLDRKALPNPELTDIENYVAPRNEIEKQLCKIWSEGLCSEGCNFSQFGRNYPIFTALH